mgnify:CR=1 FL=1
MTGQQHFNVAKDRVWLNDRAVSQQQAQPDRIDLGRNETTREQRFDLGAEKEIAVTLGVEERPDSKPVAGNEPLFAGPVVNRKCELAVESLKKIGAPVEMVKVAFTAETSGLRAGVSAASTSNAARGTAVR